MLVRIKGVVEDIIMTEGRSRENRPWQKKTYVIRDTMYNKQEYNNKVHVQDFGKLDPNSSEPVFIFKSNHIVGENVDIACYLETNDAGFTNVNYGKEYADIDKPKENAGTGNVIRPDAQPAQQPEPIEVGAESQTDLPF